METYIPRTIVTSTQRRILQCVVETIADEGYARTTIGEIGKRLGISKGMIQYHFPTKEELMQETIAYIYATARDYMSSQLRQTTNEWEQIRNFIELSCQFYRQYPVYIKALQTIRSNSLPLKHTSLAVTLYERELSDLADVFASGQKKGVLRKFDTDIAALTLRMALNGMAAKLCSQQNYNVKKHADELIGLFQRAFLA